MSIASPSAVGPSTGLPPVAADSQIWRPRLIRLLKTLLRRLFKILPFPFSFFAAMHINRKLCHLLPPGYSITFSGYYDSLSVQLNTTYPIERQMLSGVYDSST